MKNDAINLNLIIDHMYLLLTSYLKEQDWVQKDSGYYERVNKDGDGFSWVVLYPVLLEYNDMTTIWFKSGDKDLTHEAETSIFKVLKPFHDEDYIGKDFWINPLYPDGYWQNHAL